MNNFQLREAGAAVRTVVNKIAVAIDELVIVKRAKSREDDIYHIWVESESKT